MLPPEALEGAFGEGATMLQILLLLLGLIVEDIDLGKEERARGGREWGEGGNRVRGWGGSQFTLVAWPTENLFFPQSGPHTHTHTHTQPEVCIHGHCGRQGDRKRRVVQIKRRQWTQHHNCWNQSLQFQASFSPQVIDSEHTQHYWIHAGQNAGVSRTNKHPLPRPRSASDKFTILFFLKSQSMGVDMLDWPGDRGWKGGSMRGW